MRLLLLATTTGYQTRAFDEASERLGVELVFATDRCDVLEDPWRDRAIPIRFYDEDASVAAILRSAAAHPIDGALVVGDRPAPIAARVCEALGLDGHPPEAARAAGNKLSARRRFRDAGLLAPWFVSSSVHENPSELADTIRYPAVVKPVGLSGSRGVMRADEPQGFIRAFERLKRLLRSPDVRAERSEVHDAIVIEGFVAGREYALEGILERGQLHALALFDKPDPLDGPFFEETIYVTPSQAPDAVQEAITCQVTRACAALGLWHGPLHAECRVNHEGVFVLEVAARPIGGLCARSLRFERIGSDRQLLPEAMSDPPACARPFEELLLRHALGESVGLWKREAEASGVMMMPIPRRGVFRRVTGVDAARQVVGIDDVRITAKPDQVLVPLPEGASYLGFIFARGDRPSAVERALREAHRRLEPTIDPEFPIVAAAGS